jgi:P-type Cu2+ transporter
LKTAEVPLSTSSPPAESTVLHVGNLHYASEKAIVEQVLGTRPGVLAVEANPVAQTATVTFDPDRTSIAALRRWVEERGYHCAGQSVPGHVTLAGSGRRGPRGARWRPQAGELVGENAQRPIEPDFTSRGGRI